MNQLLAFFRLIRWPNLLLIALTQGLFYFCVTAHFVQPGFEELIAEKSSLFFFLAASLLLIAAAGYVINDYFDFNIDLINRPGRVLVNKFIRRRWAMFFHVIMSLAGLCLSIYAAWKSRNEWIALGNALCILMLVFYSSTFKRKLLLGNLMVSLLIAWSVLVVYLFAGGSVSDYRGFRLTDPAFDMPKLFLMAMAYSGFAFIVTLLREVVKDLEDMEGDARYGCKTIPIVWGVPAAKIFCAVWISVLLASLAVIALYALQSGWWPAALYVAAAVMMPLLLLLGKLQGAKGPDDYHRISGRIKGIMLAGILSMILFKFLP